ncbi:serine/threonine-protein kinase, partial [Reyranella sp.]|uniref:serine/threonine-protein kinase n=1 Tax=Reyranella sp. TaxID=1929291 RepID=UPI003D13B424
MSGASERPGMAQGELRGVLPAGTELRGYEMMAILGQGAFGITYRARDLTLHRDVAIKEYLPTTLALREGHTTVVPRSPEHAEQFAWGRERFLEEARTLARLDRSTAIVRVYDFLEANGTAYMIMALVEGESLSKRLQRDQSLGPEAIEQLLFPLLDGLEEVHAAGFLHRDIKPANIMVDAKGDPTLIDFGASRAAMAQRTTTMTAIFTPGYAAAEQFTSVRLGPWSDIHGLAATLYHAITGHAPPSAIDRIMKDTCVPLAQLQPAGFAPALLAGIDAGLAVRAEDRPQSIADWRSLLRGEDPGASSGEATRVVRRRRRLAHAARRALGGRIGRRSWATIAAATLLLVAGGGYLAFQSDAPTMAVATAPGLTAKQLEEALVERRRADALLAEIRELEQEARQKVEAEAEANRRADAELERARTARQKA